MKDKKFLPAVITVGLALGTAWAIRGRFGHEQGAAWAGVIGALALLLAAKRADWYNRSFRVALAAAFGWGISGVISYGLIVGYGRASDFPNAFYGLLMLFLLGLLYGFLGGGFVGLALLDSRESRIKWHALLTEMIAIGLLVYAVLINQLGWLMTPPRSEMWAACLGASIALAWFLSRNRYDAALRVAMWSALGAGFGFAFGNFLQVLGNASGAQFNFWNVMEYSIGFFGGAGMAYGVFTASWPPVSQETRPRSGNLIPIFFVAVFVPFVVWDQSFVTGRLDFVVEQGGSAQTILLFKVLAIVAIAVVAGLTFAQNRARPGDDDLGYRQTRQFFVLYTALYIFLSFLITGVFVHPVEQYLYIINFGLILWLTGFVRAEFRVAGGAPGKWAVLTFAAVIVIALFAVIAINSHGEMRGSQLRFGQH